MTEKTPKDLAQALERRDSETVRDLVEKEFEKVARGEYKWLHELIDVGYNRSDIVELLLEEANDAPWIYCDPKDQPTRSLHLPALFKNPSDIDRVCFSPPWMSKRNDIKKLVQQLCGLGGIAPTSRSLHDWNGEVTFEDNFSTSYITYSIPSLDNKSTATSNLLSRLKRVLKGFCEAAAALQSAGLCLNTFTIAHAPVLPRFLDCDVEIGRVSIILAVHLYKTLEKLPLNISSGMLGTGLLDLALDILLPFTNHDMELRIQLRTSYLPLQTCCLAAQFLCVGLVSFCQGHIGPIESVFTDHSQERSVLLGSNTLYEGGEIHYPYIAVHMTELTCLSKMIEGPLITFSLILERPEEGQWFQRNLREALSDNNTTKISRLGLDSVFYDETRLNVQATPQDILDTWGPGELVPSGNGTPWLKAIHIGGGVVYRQSESDKLHWTAGPGPENFAGTPFHRNRKITIGAPVTENLTKCSFPWKKWRASCPLVHLAVEREKWIVNQRQLGLQVGPDHAALQAIQVWNKIPGKLLKEYYLSQDDLGIMEFLSCYVGVQMSCCTGVARRIRLQELLSDLMPKFCITHMGEDEWKDWNTNYDIVAGLRKSNAHEWLYTLRFNSIDTYNTLLTHIHRILKVLEPTGLNRERTHMKLAWPKEGDLHRGLKVSCQDKHLWAQALVDSEEGVTFAYMTATCLLCERNSCQSLKESWRMAPKCLGTAVLQYRNEVEQDDDNAGTTPTTWALQNGQSYHMWNEKRCIRLYAESLPQQQYRLTASESAIPKHLMTRLFRSKRVKRNLLREKHHPEDVAIDVLIVDKE